MSAVIVQERSETPCGCPTNIAGGAICQERTGFPGSYCLAERQAEERAADERKCSACNGTGTRRICCEQPVQDNGLVCCGEYDHDDCNECEGTGEVAPLFAEVVL